MVGAWHGNLRHQPTGHAALSRRFDCQGELLGNVVDQQRSHSHEGCAENGYGGWETGNRNRSTREADRRGDGMRRHENPVERQVQRDPDRRGQRGQEPVGTRIGVSNTVALLRKPSNAWAGASISAPTALGSCRPTGPARWFPRSSQSRSVTRTAHPMWRK